MIVTVSGATAAIERFLAEYPEGRGRVGHMLNPQSHNSMITLLTTGLPIVADNGCFTGFNEAEYFAMVKRIKLARVPRNRLWWVTVPDKVADAEGTRQLWNYWHHSLRGAGLPMAFVAQDGCEQYYLPWGKMDCLFIGGSMEWKLGPIAASLIHQAKRMGKKVHVGRIYTNPRIEYFHALGADSIDSTYFSRHETRYLRPALHRLAIEPSGFFADVPEYRKVYPEMPPDGICPTCGSARCFIGICLGYGPPKRLPYWPMRRREGN